MRAFLYLGLLSTVACTPATAASTPKPIELRPYLTSTPLATPSPPEALVVTPPPGQPTATPSIYTIQTGDTLSQIAEKFRVSLDSLISENPDVDPGALPVGQTLKIPGHAVGIPTNASPTPEPLQVEQVKCHRVADGGLWCFVLVRNEYSELIENVSAEVMLVGSDGGRLASKMAVLPLDILAPGRALPLAVFFPPGIPGDATPRVQLLTAIRLLPDQTAASVWVAAVAYDEAGNVVGVRRWESDAGVEPGQSTDFSFMISAVSGRIDRVDYAVEAVP